MLAHQTCCTHTDLAQKRTRLIKTESDLHRLDAGRRCYIAGCTDVAAMLAIVSASPLAGSRPIQYYIYAHARENHRATALRAADSANLYAADTHKTLRHAAPVARWALVVEIVKVGCAPFLLLPRFVHYHAAPHFINRLTLHVEGNNEHVGVDKRIGKHRNRPHQRGVESMLKNLLGIGRVGTNGIRTRLRDEAMAAIFYHKVEERPVALNTFPHGHVDGLHLAVTTVLHLHLPKPHERMLLS